MNLQDSEASDAKTLQSQNSQNAKIRILPNALRVVHGRRLTPGARQQIDVSDAEIAELFRSKVVADTPPVADRQLADREAVAAGG